MADLGLPRCLSILSSPQVRLGQLLNVMHHAAQVPLRVERKTPSVRRSKHLCADAGYRGKRALHIIASHGYEIPSLAEGRAKIPLTINLQILVDD